jgi:hypothetical protein
VSQSAANQACGDATASLAECLRAFGPDCSDIATKCSTDVNRRNAACRLTSGEGDSCIFAKDGSCDEPDFCAAGTDTSDCAAANSCTLAYDGTCEEGEECAFGTDTADCS